MKPNTRCIFAICFVLAYMAIVSAAFDTVTLDVPHGANEATWRDAMAEQWGGQTEVVIPFGRIDVETDDCVVELDFAKKWTECFGQTLFYADFRAGKQGVMALIYPEGVSDKDKEKLQYIEKLAKKYDVRVVVLIKGEK